MVGFIVPIKSKKFAKNWDKDNFLLERTARSICGQLDQNFKMVIVHNEKPDIKFEHKNIVYTHFTLPYLLYNEIEDYESYVCKYYSSAYAEKMMDKSRKIIWGCNVAKELGCTYLMSVDSDDLISNQITGYVNDHANDHGPGWRITNGYVYRDGSGVVLKQKAINEICGSTHIIRQDLVAIPDFSTNKFWDYSLFESHGYTVGRIRDYNKEHLLDLPFKGMIYIRHGDNYSGVHASFDKLSVKNVIKMILHGKLITKKMRKEFHLY